LSVAVKRQRAADIGTKIYPTKAREQPADLIEKPEIAVLNADSSNFRSHRQSRFFSGRFTVEEDLRHRGKISWCRGQHRSRVHLDRFAFCLRLGNASNLFRRSYGRW